MVGHVRIGPAVGGGVLWIEGPRLDLGEVEEGGGRGGQPGDGRLGDVRQAVAVPVDSLVRQLQGPPGQGHQVRQGFGVARGPLYVGDQLALFDDGPLQGLVGVLQETQLAHHGPVGLA